MAVTTNIGAVETRTVSGELGFVSRYPDTRKRQDCNWDMWREEISAMYYVNTTIMVLLSSGAR